MASKEVGKAAARQCVAAVLPLQPIECMRVLCFCCCHALGREGEGSNRVNNRWVVFLLLSLFSRRAPPGRAEALRVSSLPSTAVDLLHASLVSILLLNLLHRSFAVASQCTPLTRSAPPPFAQRQSTALNFAAPSHMHPFVARLHLQAPQPPPPLPPSASQSTMAHPPPPQPLRLRAPLLRIAAKLRLLRKPHPAYTLPTLCRLWTARMEWLPKMQAVAVAVAVAVEPAPGSGSAHRQPTWPGPFRPRAQDLPPLGAQPRVRRQPHQAEWVRGRPFSQNMTQNMCGKYLVPALVRLQPGRRRT
jgi:hypothetical protein